MKKLVSLSILGIAVLTLSGCGSSGGDNIYVAPPPIIVDPAPLPPVIDPEPLPPIIDPEPLLPIEELSVNLYDLTYGYAVEGYSSYGEQVSLDYCANGYDLYRGNEHFHGEFNTNGYTINMYDSDGGSYVIDTDDGYLDVGENYYIYDIDTDITVEAIYPIPC